MKNELRILLAAPLAAALFACDGEGPDVTSREDDLGTPPTVETERDHADAGDKHGDAGTEGPSCLQPQLGDCTKGQVAAIVKTANTGEIELSKSVLDRVSDPAVRKLAEQLIAEHQKANDELLVVLDENDITPIPNANTKALTEATKLTIESLSKKSGSELDASFVSTQLLKHAQVLGTIDHVLLPSAAGTPLEAYLKKTRTAVAAHTKDIAETQAKVAGKCGGEEKEHADGGKPHPDDDRGHPDAGPTVDVTRSPNEGGSGPSVTR